MKPRGKDRPRGKRAGRPLRILLFCSSAGYYSPRAASNLAREISGVKVDFIDRSNPPTRTFTEPKSGKKYTLSVRGFMKQRVRTPWELRLRELDNSEVVFLPWKGKRAHDRLFKNRPGIRSRLDKIRSDGHKRIFDVLEAERYIRPEIKRGILRRIRAQ